MAEAAVSTLSTSWICHHTNEQQKIAAVGAAEAAEALWRMVRFRCGLRIRCHRMRIFSTHNLSMTSLLGLWYLCSKKSSSLSSQRIGELGIEHSDSHIVFRCAIIRFTARDSFPYRQPLHASKLRTACCYNCQLLRL
jgi:hypothetical protein